jgi:hypothetical protein
MKALLSLSLFGDDCMPAFVRSWALSECYVPQGCAVCLQATTATDPAPPDSAAADELQQQYLAEFERQYQEQLRKMAAEKLVAKAEKVEVKKEEAIESDNGIFFFTLAVHVTDVLHLFLQPSLHVLCRPVYNAT